MGTTITLVQFEAADATSAAEATATLTEAIERHGGRVVTQWKRGLSAMFLSASDAVRLAMQTQAGFRIGVTSGDVDDVDGPIAETLAVAASQLCSIALPGHVVVSEVVRALCGTSLEVTFALVGGVTIGSGDSATTVHRVRWKQPIGDSNLRVAVADDAPLIRSGIVRLLGDSGFSVIAEVGDAEALLAAVDADQPDLVITDIRMPPTNTDEGLRAAAEIRARYPTVAVLVLSQYIEAEAAAELLDGRPAGIGYLLKERVSDLDEFIAACHYIVTGGSIVDSIVAEQLLRGLQDRDLVSRLTDREREVLALMAQGRSNAAIAETLFLGAKTVESHVRAIFQKLDLEETPEGNRRVQAVLQWLHTSKNA